MDDNLFDILLDPNNPIVYSILATLLILTIFYLFYRYIIIPLNKKHSIEKNELEIKHIKLMALFADMDPDPVLRVNTDGVVTYTNNAARYIPEFSNMHNRDINELIENSEFDLVQLITNNSNHLFSGYINKKYYMINIRGNSDMAMAQFYFHDITESKRFENHLKKSKRKIRLLSQHLLNNIEDERERIAKELHDGIGQNMLFLKMKLHNLQELLDKEGLKNMNGTINLLEDTIKELRNIIYELKPKLLEDMGLKAAIQHLCDQVACDSRISGKVDIISLEERLGKETEIIIFRIVQELLNNVVKHSKAKNFSVQLIKNSGEIRIIVTDDGTGFNYKEFQNEEYNVKGNSGYGLSNLVERVSSLNGVLKIDSSPNTGTMIIAKIPMN